MAYLCVLDMILIPLIVQTDIDHRNSKMYQAMQIGVLQPKIKKIIQFIYILIIQKW